MVDSDTNDSRWRLVGKLIRSYREDDTHGGGPLSLDVLLHLMSVHRDVEGWPYDREDISRWEGGQGPIPAGFLLDFCNALEIAPSELSHMMSLAGYDSGGQDHHSEPDQILPLLKDIGKRVVPPSVYALLGGVCLTLLQLDGAVVLMAYVLGLYIFVGGMFMWRWRTSDNMVDLVGDLLFVTIIAILCMGLLSGVAIRIDHYNFHSLSALEDLPLAFMAVILSNILLSAAASFLFVLLRGRLYTEYRSRTGPYLRAVGTTLPPILLLYLVSMPLNNPGGWIANAVALGILFGAVTVILACGDTDVKISEWERKWGHMIAIEVIVILCIIGVAGMVVTYLDPSIALTSAPNNLLLPAPLDFAALGYPESEYEGRFRVGMLWMFTTIIVFLATVAGSYLVATIRKGGVESAVA